MYKVIMTFLVAVCPIISNAAQYICSQPVLSMHTEAKELSSVVSQVLWGMPLEVLGMQDQQRWTKVRTQDQCEGWVLTSGLAKYEGGAYPLPGYKAQVNSLYAHVFLVQDVRLYPPLMCLPFGAIVEVMADMHHLPERWIPVRLLDGQIAYIQKGDLVFNPQPISQDEMLTLADRFIGLPFVWGGTSSFGYDCSGFVQMLYRQMGINLPRKSYLQNALTQMQDVSLSKLKPADLLFFSDRTDEVITHVGMYVGNNEFIHAALVPTPIIQKTSMNDSYWSAQLKRAARYINE